MTSEEIKPLTFLCSDPEAPTLGGVVNKFGSVTLSTGETFANIKDMMTVLKGRSPKYMPVIEDEATV